MSAAVVGKSLQTLESDPEKCLRTSWEACNSLIRVKGGTLEPQMVICLIFIVADRARSLFRSIDQVLPATMVAAIETPKLSNIGLGQLSIFSMVCADLGS